MGSPPTGTIVFLMTDIVGSTALWEADAAAMAKAVERLDALIGDCTEHHGGTVVKNRGEGDSAFIVFEKASDALKAATDIQLAIGAEAWPNSCPLRVRMGVHLGEAQHRGGDYFAPTVNRCARIKALAAGGQILISDTVNRVVADSLDQAFELRDLGVHRLKDLLKPERLWQIVHPDLVAEFPPLPSLEHTPNNLPVQLTSFIGRERDLIQVIEAIRGHRLVTLLGPGGTGKTRLSLQVAAELLETFRDGVWFVPLASVEERHSILEAIARVLKVQESADSDLEQRIIETIADRPMLLVLDNCEQIVEPARGIVRRLLEATKATVLATSRHPLRIGGEFCFPVQPLSLPDSRFGLTAEEVAASEAVQLLLDRARARKPNFELDDGNATWIAKICRRLDGVPLAIELAAPKLAMISPKELYERLADSLKVLKGGHDEAERHQTIESAIAWSHRLLNEKEATLFRRLAAFSSSWTMAGAEAACASDEFEAFDVMDTLQTLLDKSLAVVTEGSSGETRYFYLETIRAYAKRELERHPEEEAAARERVFDFMLALAQEADRKLQTSEQELGIELCYDEYDNFRGALEWGLGSSLGTKTLDMALALHRFWLSTSQFREGKGWLDQAFNAAPDAPQDKRAAALNILGICAWYQNDLSSALQLCSESGALWRGLGNPEREVAAINNVALIAIRLQDFAAARTALTQCLDFYSSQGNERRVSDVATNLGSLERDLGNYEESLNLLSLALSAKRTLGDRVGMATVLESMADSYWLSGQPIPAMHALKEGLEIMQSLENPMGSSGMLEALAIVATELHDASFAARLLGAADGIRISTDTPPEPWEMQRREEAESRLRAQTEGANREAMLTSGRLATHEAILREAFEWIGKAQGPTTSLD